MTVIVYREDLTAAELRAMGERYAPYDNFAAFWTGFIDYQAEIDRKCPHDSNSVAGQAWDRGTEAAMRIHWERHSDPYARDDLDSRVMIVTLEGRNNPKGGWPANDNRPRADA
jgi:hypothetical protein